ncbi:hypothetical protein ACS0TY_024634 [Phlomoides rotata]
MPEGGQPKEILMLPPDLGPVGGCSEGRVLVSVSRGKGRPRIMTPHNDSLVVSANIMGTKVHRLLVDTGSYVNIIFRRTLDKL